MKLLGVGESNGLRTRSLNDQERDPIHRNRRVKDERERARMRALIALPPRTWTRGHLAAGKRLVVELTRVAPGQPLDDHDNLRGALKAYVDGIADHLGVDDGDRTRVRWLYAQERGPWAVRFTVSEELLEATP